MAIQFQFVFGKRMKPNQEEKDFYDAINKIHEICRDYLAEYYGDNEGKKFE